MSQQATIAKASIAWFLPNAYGHVKPSLHMIKLIVQQGHTVICYGTDDYKRLIEASGATFVFVGGDKYQNFRSSHHNPAASPIAALQPAAVAILPLVLRRLRQDKPACVVHDHLCPWGAYAAAVIRVPSVCIITSVVPEASEVEDLAEKNPLAQANAINQRAICALKDDYGIVTSWKEALTTFSPLCNIVTTNALLHPAFTTKYPPSSFHFVGAVSGPEVPSIAAGADSSPDEVTRNFLQRLNKLTRQRVGESSDDEKLPESLDKRGCSVVYVSMGTEVQETQKFWQSVCAALQSMPDCVVVVALGRSAELPDVSPSCVGRLVDGTSRSWPDNFCVYEYAPQEAILAVADCFVTHSGMNSTIESLRAGVPMVCIPHFSDQPYVANQVCEEIGAGVFLDRYDVSSASLSNAVRSVLSDSAIRQAAQQHAKVFRSDSERAARHASALIMRVAECKGDESFDDDRRMALLKTNQDVPIAVTDITTGDDEVQSTADREYVSIPPSSRRWRIEPQPQMAQTLDVPPAKPLL